MSRPGRQHARRLRHDRVRHAAKRRSAAAAPRRGSGRHAAPREPTPSRRRLVARSTTSTVLRRRRAATSARTTFSQFIRNAETGVRRTGLFEGRGPARDPAASSFVGGLALNLTPCVLPMIPINLAIIGAGAQAGSRSRGFLLGVGVRRRHGARLRRARPGRHPDGRHVRHDQRVAVVQSRHRGRCSSCSALAMFDVIVIDFSQLLGSRFQRRRGRPRHVSRGVRMGARRRAARRRLRRAGRRFRSCCSRATSTRPARRAALALPFFLGIGMAIPWPIAGAGIAALPKPGAWMVRVKQVFGVVILATAAYYGYQAYGLFANRWVDAADVSASVEEKLKEGWHASLADGPRGREARAEAGADRPVGHVVQELPDDGQDDAAGSGRDAALAGYVKIKFQAEDPDDQRVSPRDAASERTRTAHLRDPEAQSLTARRANLGTLCAPGLSEGSPELESRAARWTSCAAAWVAIVVPPSSFFDRTTALRAANRHCGPSINARARRRSRSRICVPASRPMWRWARVSSSGCRKWRLCWSRRRRRRRQPAARRR